MKKFFAVTVSLLIILSASIFSSTAASAMPCNGKGCPQQSYTGYPEGQKPGTVFTKRSPTVVKIDCFYGLKYSRTVTTRYTYKYVKGVWKKVVLSNTATFQYRPVSKKECPTQWAFNPAGH